MKKLLMYLIVVVIILLCLPIFITLNYEKTPTDNEIVLFVNTEEVTYREFELFLQEHRAEVFSYFHNKYGANDSKTFWITSYNGEVPIEKLKEKAVQVCIELKVQQQLGRKYSLWMNDYSEFIELLEKENAGRKESINKGLPIFGPHTYGEKEYYNYLFTNMVIRLQEKLDIDVKDYDKLVKNFIEKAELKFNNKVYTRIKEV